MAYADDGTRVVVTYGWESTSYWTGNNRRTVVVVDAANGKTRLAVPEDMETIGEIDVAGHLLAVPLCAGGAPPVVLSVDWSREAEVTVVGRAGVHAAVRA